MRSDRPTINSSLGRKVIRRRRDKNVIARERYRRAVRCVEAVAFYDLRCSCVAANAKADSGRRDDNVRICRAPLLISMVGSQVLPPSIERGMPPHVNVGEQYAPVRLGRDRANA